MTNEEEKEKLISFFESLPAKDLKKLVAKIEQDRNQNKFGIPHDAIMALLRPSLSIIRAPRIQTPLRILCEPFEDNLVNEDHAEKQEGRISRASINSMVVWLQTDLIPQEYAEIAEAYTLAQERGLEKESAILAHHFWQKSSAAIQKSLGDCASIERETVEKLGGINRAYDIRDMAFFLEIARHVEAMRKHLDEKPIEDLIESEIVAVSQEYENVASGFPGREPFLLLSVMGRLTKPFPIVKVLKEIAANGNGKMMSDDEMGAAGAALFSALEEEAETALHSFAQEDIPETTLARKVKQFAGSYKNMADDLCADKDSDFGKRLHKAREAVCNAVETRILASAEDVIMGAVASGADGIAPDLSDWPDEKDFELSEQRALALAGTLNISEQLGVYGACASKANELRKKLGEQSDAIIQNLRTVKADGIGMAGAHLATAVRLLEIIAGPEEADTYRKRGEAELMAAMAQQEITTYAL